MGVHAKESSLRYKAFFFLNFFRYDKYLKREENIFRPCAVGFPAVFV